MNATSKRATSKRSTSRTSPGGGIFGDPGAIAPSVDKTWRDDLIIELRLLDVPGDDIGDALMTVETHVAESGETAQEAFGDARAYAREIAESTDAAGRGRGITAWTAASSVLGLLGMLGAMRAFTGWLEGTDVSVTIGDLAGLVALLVIAALLLTGHLLRPMVEHRWLAFVVPLVLVGVLAGLLALLSEPLLDLPTVALGGVSVLLLLVSVLIAWHDQRGDTGEITAPGAGPTSGTALRVLSLLIMPLMTLFLLGMVWVLHLLTR